MILRDTSMVMEMMMMFRVMFMAMEMILNTMTVMVRTDVEEVGHQTIDTSEDDKLGQLRISMVTILCLLLINVFWSVECLSYLFLLKRGAKITCEVVIASLSSPGKGTLTKEHFSWNYKKTGNGLQKIRNNLSALR